MSNLTLALHSAVSSMHVNQAALGITSNNISNANTEGYSRKIVSQQSLLLDGTGAGVQLADIGRNVSEYLLRDLNGQLSDLGKVSVQTTFFERTQESFGTLASDSSLSAYLSDYAAALEALALTPEDSAIRFDVVNAGARVADWLNENAERVQELRHQADKDITAAVDIVNTQLGKIVELNEQISANLVRGLPVGDLEDERDLALKAVSEQIDIKYFKRDNGEIAVYTAAGHTLVDEDANPLTHTAATSINAAVVYGGAGIDGIDVNGVDITTTISSGRIAGLIEMRDKALPELTAEIDRLAGVLRDDINAIHNDGVGVPVRRSLTGTQAFPAGAGTPVKWRA